MSYYQPLWKRIADGFEAIFAQLLVRSDKIQYKVPKVEKRKRLVGIEKGGGVTAGQGGEGMNERYMTIFL